METLNITTNKETLIVREGDAPKSIDQLPFVLTGNIDSVAEYINKMKPGTFSCVVIADLNDLVLKLDLNITNSLRSNVFGFLKENEKLKNFEFNTGKTFNLSQIIQLIRFNRNIFKNKDNSVLLEKLLDFQAETNLKFNSKDDLKGNYNKSLIREKKNNVDMTFKIEAEIYKGENPIEFEVEIIAEQVDSGVVKFYFESIDFEELKEELKKSIFKRELDKIDDIYVKIING